MDNLGKCHGKINIMIGLKANGSSSNWLPPIHCRTCDAHMSISNKPHHKETKANTVKCWKTHRPPASPLLPYRSNVNYCSCLISMKEIFFFKVSYQHLSEMLHPVSKCWSCKEEQILWNAGCSFIVGLHGSARSCGQKHQLHSNHFPSPSVCSFISSCSVPSGSCFRSFTLSNSLWGLKNASVCSRKGQQELLVRARLCL